MSTQDKRGCNFLHIALDTFFKMQRDMNSGYWSKKSDSHFFVGLICKNNGLKYNFICLCYFQKS